MGFTDGSVVSSVLVETAGPRVEVEEVVVSWRVEVDNARLS